MVSRVKCILLYQKPKKFGCVGRGDTTSKTSSKQNTKN